MALDHSSVDDLGLPLKDLPTKSPQSTSVATLQPFIPDPLPQRNRKNRNNESRSKNIEILPGIFERTSYNKYLTLKFDDERVEDIDMFKICKEITTICGREPKMAFQNDGSLLVECTSLEESEKLQSLEIMNGKKAKCTPHKSLNTCKGVIRSPYLMRYSEERLQEEFASQQVVDVKQMKKKVDGVLIGIPTYVLTFNLIRLPCELKAAWLRLEVRPYIPSPRRCFYCQRFGHVTDSCRRKLKGEKKICYNCGKEDHGECNNPSFCVNCNDCHPASSKICDRYLLEKEIQTTRAKEHITFPEAKKRVMSQYIRPGVSFASILDKAKKAPKPQEIRSSETPKNNSVIKTSTTNTKRRRSIEEHDASPTCKSNRFEILSDEMECNTPNLNIEPDNTTDDLGHDSTLTLVRSVVRAEVHVPACSVEQAGTSTSVDLEESSGVAPLVILGESVGGLPSSGFWEPPTSESPVPLGDSVGSVSSPCSLEQAGDMEAGPFRGNVVEEKTKKKVTVNTNSNSSKTTVPGNRKLKVSHSTSNNSKLKTTKADEKKSVRGTLIKDSSRNRK